MSSVALLHQRRLRELLRPDALLAAVEGGLAAMARGELAVAPTVHLPFEEGGFHLKSAFSRTAPLRAVAKLNGNFPGNPERHGLPTIQGLVALLDGERGAVLALLDSMALTSLRTAATSVVAAKWLARPDTTRLAVVGCGLQGLDHLELFAHAFSLERVACFDRRRAAAEALAARARERGLEARAEDSSAAATRGAGIIVTATTSTDPWLAAADVDAGAFVAAVGADNPHKSELEPALLARSAVVVDSLAVAAAGGDLRTALLCGAMREADVRAELPAVVAGLAPGRLARDERVIFDSTGLAATDLAVASLAFEEAARGGETISFDFARR